LHRAVAGLALAAAVLLPVGCSSGGTAAGDPLSVDTDTPRGRLVAMLPAEAAARGVYVMDPAAPEYPGSRFDVLLPTASGSLLVEAPAGPLALLVDGSGADTPAGATRLEVPGAGRVLLSGPAARRDAAAERAQAQQTASAALARLARSTAPLAWAGTPADGVEALVELSGDQLRAELRGQDPDRLAEQVRDLARGSLPGSPGKRWSDVLADVEVRTTADVVVVTARTVALPPALLRSLLDGTVGPAGG
jgi:hypothetical protein